MLTLWRISTLSKGLCKQWRILKRCCGEGNKRSVKHQGQENLGRGREWKREGGAIYRRNNVRWNSFIRWNTDYEVPWHYIPYNHLMAFDSQMDLYNALGAIRCRLFPVILQGTGAKWYRQYREKMIYSWKQFSYEFSAQFCICKDPTIDYTVLANIKQGPKESLGDYLKRFNAEALKAKGMNDMDKLIPVHSSLVVNTPIWKELFIHGRKDLQDFHFHVDMFIRMDELDYSKRKSGFKKDTGHPGFDKYFKRPKWEGIVANTVALNKPLSYIMQWQNKRSTFRPPSRQRTILSPIRGVVTTVPTIKWMGTKWMNAGFLPGSSRNW